MEITGYLSLLVCLIGLIFYLIVANRPKVEQVAWNMFLWGMVIFLACNCSARFHLWGSVTR